LFVSHDRYFLNRVADHLLIIEPGRVRLVEGNYDAYQLVLSGRPGDAETRGRGDTGTGGQVDAGTRRRGDSGAAGASAKTRRRFPFRKIADIEKEIFRRESHIEEINRQLGREETCRDGQLVRRLKSQRADEQEALKTLYAHWEEANELNW